MKPSPQFYAVNRDEWRSWLENNHAKEKEIWLVFFRKSAGKPGVNYEDAVDEAICFGWIDSIVKKIDDERYTRKFTPRTGKTHWSTTNKARAERLIQQGRMTSAGFSKIDKARKNGSWNETPTSGKTWNIPPELEEALKTSEPARINFEKLAPSYRRRYAGWIASAKHQETRQKRAAEVIDVLGRNQKLGMK